MKRHIFYREVTKRYIVLLGIIALILIAVVPANQSNPTLPWLYGMIAFLLVLIGAVWASRKQWPVAVTEAGVEARNYVGALRPIEWDDIERCVGSYKIVHFLSKSSPKAWISATLFLENREEFLDAIIEFAPLENPARDWAVKRKENAKSK